MNRSKIHRVLLAIALASSLGTAAVADEVGTFERDALKDTLAAVASSREQAAIVGRELAERALEALKTTGPERPAVESRLAAVTRDRPDRS